MGGGQTISRKILLLDIRTLVEPTTVPLDLPDAAANRQEVDAADTANWNTDWSISSLRPARLEMFEKCLKQLQVSGSSRILGRASARHGGPISSKATKRASKGADGISAFFRVASSQKLRNVLHERVRDPAQEAIDPLHDHYMLVAPDTGNS